MNRHWGKYTSRHNIYVISIKLHRKTQLNHKFTVLDKSGHTDFTTFVKVADVYVNTTNLSVIIIT